VLGEGDPGVAAGNRARRQVGAEGVRRYCADPASATQRSGYECAATLDPAYLADLNERIQCFLGCAPGHAILLSEGVLAGDAATARQLA
jgi:hypothetical protein